MGDANVRRRRLFVSAALALTLLPTRAGTAFAGSDVEASAPIPPIVRTFTVRYVSAENVYLAGGTAGGLAVGDTLTIERDGNPIGHVVVAYVAEHSASATAVEGTLAARPGDRARAILRRAAAPGPVEGAMPATPAARDDREGLDRGATTQEPGRPLARVSGSAGFEWEYVADDSDANLDFARPTLRLDLKAREILGGHHTLQLKGRLRYDDRTHALSSTVPESEWRDRIYVFSLGYEKAGAPYSYELGRIAGPTIGGIGYLDGALVSRRISPAVSAGLFAGLQPDWRDADPQGSIRKTGGFMRYENASGSARRVDGAVAFVGEYHGPTVSREFVVLASRLWSRTGWSLSQSAEIDVNRGWRFERAGERLSLTSVWLMGQARPLERLGLSLAYDGRTPHLTYDMRSVPESLIDEAFRDGLRGRISVRAARDWNVALTGGARRREGDDELTRSFGATITGARFPSRQMSLTAGVRGFAGEIADGVNPTLRLRRSFPQGHHLAVGGSAYLYRSAGLVERRENYSAGVDGAIQLRALHVGAEYERRFGDDLPGHRLVGEIGVRF
jgi:hypothetical protein